MLEFTGADGAVYKFHLKFRHLMMEKITELIPSTYKFKFISLEDASGRGAALVAAVASRKIKKLHLTALDDNQ